MAKVIEAPGKTLLVGDRYEVDEDQPLGLGGMATVYRGLDTRTGQAVALKTLRPDYQDDPAAVERFRQEARMMAFVSHPNLVAMREVVEQGDSTWLVMDLVEGKTLKQMVEERGPMKPKAILPILVQVADALGELHRRKLVHLDIKPQNIMLMSSGAVKIIDFGLAQPAGPRQDMIAGTAFGTVAYLAPEQASGEAIDSSTDVYSLGCVVYELLTGRPPFEAPAGPEQKDRLIRSHLEEIPTAPSILIPQLPAWVDDVTGWALAKSRKERFHDVATFARMFRSGTRGEMVPGTHATLPKPVERTDAFTVAERTSTFGDRWTLPKVRWPGRGEDSEGVEREKAAAPAEEIERGPSLAGRAIRHSGKVVLRTMARPRLMVRFAMTVMAALLVIGTTSLAVNGPESTVESVLAFAPVAKSQVSVDGLNLRTSPTANSDSSAVLAAGTGLTLRGLPEDNLEGTWWPVAVSVNGQDLEGWVWGGGIASTSSTGALNFADEATDPVGWMGDQVDMVRDGLSLIWPF